MKIYPCSEQKEPEFPLTWGQAMETEGIYAISGNGLRRMVVLRNSPNVVAFFVDGAETWPPMCPLRSPDWMFRLLPNAKLCMEVRE